MDHLISLKNISERCFDISSHPCSLSVVFPLLIFLVSVFHVNAASHVW